MDKNELLAQGAFATVVILPLWSVQTFSGTRCLPLIHLLAQQLLVILAVLGGGNCFGDVFSQVLSGGVVLSTRSFRALWGRHISK